ncbi:hypothetical protein QAD02_015102 [Eretmocerus hayati]|uniref:Uncharacterized protein n=1 Tax=Eretmocerus hayati TaxID=131215 RepID=A0ACC2P6V3_9HYME|nr:hypothetical protein QAD02_015102 [Eretmocerus hayati]
MRSTCNFFSLALCAVALVGYGSGQDYSAQEEQVAQQQNDVGTATPLLLDFSEALKSVWNGQKNIPDALASMELKRINKKLYNVFGYKIVRISECPEMKGRDHGKLFLTTLENILTKKMEVNAALADGLLRLRNKVLQYFGLTIVPVNLCLGVGLPERVSPAAPGVPQESPSTATDPINNIPQPDSSAQSGSESNVGPSNSGTTECPCAKKKQPGKQKS